MPSDPISSMEPVSGPQDSARETCVPFNVVAAVIDEQPAVDLALNPGVSRAEAKWSQAAAKKAAQARKRKRKERDKQSVEETGESDA